MENPETIYKKFNQKIFNLAFRITGNRDDASDITQETFLQVFKSLDKFKGESQLYTWIYKIAKNKCIRFLDKKKKTTLTSLQELIDNACSPVSEEISEIEKSNYILQVKDGCLSGLLRSLSFQQRMAFILNVLLEMPIEQISGILDKSENATRILVHRAKQNLKDFLCANCSLYDAKNRCRCENLINYSLNQGWLNNDPNNMKNKRMVSEIHDLKNVIGLYKTMQEPIPPVSIENYIKHFLSENHNFLIFQNKKVK